MNARNGHAFDARKQRLLAALALLLLLLLGSGWHPYDRLTWFMEVLPVVIALPILMATYRRFPLTNLVYGLLFVQAVILMVGGMYTYARVPIGSTSSRINKRIADSG